MDLIEWGPLFIIEDFIIKTSVFLSNTTLFFYVIKVYIYQYECIL